MAKYTMTILEMMNNPLINIFPENYPFYTSNESERKEFEETFILTYLTNEIGFESPYLFQQKLLGKLKLIMPYYEQLYQTEWQRVGKDMMNQKDLTDTTTHTLTQTLIGQQQTKQTGESNQNNQSNDAINTSSNSESNGKVSNLADGVSSASLDNGYLTGVSHSDDTASGTSENTSNSTATMNQTAASNQSTNNQTILEETTTFNSHGDVGIQTPAYSISEWRRVLININQLIIEDCRDLFMKIY